MRVGVIRYRVQPVDPISSSQWKDFAHDSLHRLIFLPICEQGTSSQEIGITVDWDAGDKTGMVFRSSGRGWEGTSSPDRQHSTGVH